MKVPDKEAENDLEAACAELVIFPLPQVVLFPRALLPLHVFEPRYRAMLKDCLETTRAMAVALIPHRSDTNPPPIARVAGAGFIVEHQALPDGRSNILLHGKARVSLEELPFVPPYRRARATILQEVHTPVPETERVALMGAQAAFVAALAKRSPDPGKSPTGGRVSFQLPRSLEIGAVADLSAHHLIVDAAERQSILEELDVRERVRKVTAALASQLSGILREGGGGPN